MTPATIAAVVAQIQAYGRAKSQAKCLELQCTVDVRKRRLDIARSIHTIEAMDAASSELADLDGLSIAQLKVETAVCN